MLNRLFGRGSLPALEAMLTFASARQKVLAANIANVDTAGYRARDLSETDFQRLLRGQEERAAFREGPAADAGPLKPGANNVDLELETAKMVRNSALHSTAASLLTHQFALLREAIAGHVIQ
jgi:flagellar basal-body rod protein FlgB